MSEPSTWLIRRNPTSRHWYVSRSQPRELEVKNIILVDKKDYDKLLQKIKELESRDQVLALPVGVNL